MHVHVDNSAHVETSATNPYYILVWDYGYFLATPQG